MIRFGSLIKVLGALAIVSGVIWLAWSGYAYSQINSYKFRSIKPGIVNFVAVQPGAGYRILVANSVAQLAEVSEEEFDRPESNDSASSSNDVISKAKMPMRDMIGSMSGNTENLTKFVLSLNGMSVNDLPPVRVIWKSEDIDKAIAGDAKLKAKLETDLNTKLNGDPLEQIDPEALENGIVIEYPVSISVKIVDKIEKKVIRIQEAYRTGFASRVVDRYKEKAVVTPELLKGYYLEEAAKVQEGKNNREDLTKTLPDRYSKQRAETLAIAPERVLTNTEVILTEEFLSNAIAKESVASSGQRIFDIYLNLNHEGRMRLWKYSREHPGFQLLMIVDGIAIAAPRIGSELATYDVKISQLTDKRLAFEAADRINQLKKQENKQ